MKILKSCRILVLFSMYGDRNTAYIYKNDVLVARNEGYSIDGFAFQTVIDISKNDILKCDAIQIEIKDDTNLTIIAL